MRCFKSSILFSIAAIFLLGRATSFAQTSLTITFDGPPPQPPGTEYGTKYYQESGMVFTPATADVDGQFSRCGGGISYFPENGTAYLQDGTSLVFSFTNGILFSLVSVDLASYSVVDPDPIDIQFVGHRFDGSFVTNSFSGTATDFQTFQFGPEFTNLTQVEVFGNSWSLDNLVVQPGPPVLSIIMMDWLYLLPDDSSIVDIASPMLSFTTVANQSYALEFSTNLSSGSWSILPGVDWNLGPLSNIVGDGNEIQIVDTNALASPQRFYRVRVLQ